MEDMSKYNTQRENIIKKYKTQKRNNIISILGVCAALLIAVILLNKVIGFPAAIVLSFAIVMISIIFMRIRIVTINHIMQQSLIRFEENGVNY